MRGFPVHNEEIVRRGELPCDCSVMSISVSEIEAIIEPVWVALGLSDNAVVDTMASIGVELLNADRVCPVGLCADAVGQNSSPTEGDNQVIIGPGADRRIVVECVAGAVLHVDGVCSVLIALPYEVRTD